MHATTTWTEGGGVGKTATTQAIGKACADLGYETLVVDLDGQKGGLSLFLGVLDQAETAEGETIVDHLTNTATGDIDNLIQTVEGMDVLPSSRRLRDLNRHMQTLPDDPYLQQNPHTALRQLIERTELYKDYDIMIVDVPGGIESLAPRMSLFATQNVMIPFKPNQKGSSNLDGVVENITTFERAHKIDIGIVGMIPYNVRAQRKAVKSAKESLKTRLKAYKEQADRRIPIAPVTIGQREALIENAWEAQHTIFKHVEEQSNPADRNVETLEQFRQLGEWMMYQLSDGAEGATPDENTEFQWSEA